MNLSLFATKVEAIDLSGEVAATVARDDLPADRAAAAERSYRQFLTLVLAYPNKTICVPSDADLLWHQHLLASAKYRGDCTALCGRQIDHDPTAFGTPAFTAAWRETVALYQTHFGVRLDPDPTARGRTPLSPAACYRPGDELPDEWPLA